MDCENAHPLLAAYFDGELDRSAGRELETHIDGCAACRAALVELDELRGSLRRELPQHVAPAALRARIVAANAATRPRSRPRIMGLALAASWALAFCAGALLTPWFSRDRADTGAGQVERDLLASHWRALAATSPVDVVSSDRHTVKPWFAGKVADAPQVRDFAEQGFPLVGGRIDYVGGSRVPVLVYRHGQHLIDVFVFDAASGLSLSDAHAARGSTLLSAELGGQHAAIVTDMDAQETTALKRLLEQHM
ncbi:MAG: zf-HC2 domain-containing protein [Rudaea sp.]